MKMKLPNASTGMELGVMAIETAFILNRPTDIPNASQTVNALLVESQVDLGKDPSFAQARASSSPRGT
jgi:hypothetical protein